MLGRKIFGNLNVLKKMLVIGALTLLSFIIISAIFLMAQKNMMLLEKKSKLTNIVELSYSLVEHEYNEFKAGIIDEQTAKTNAINAIKNLRYDLTNYIWINDDTEPFPRMIMHPISTSLNGKVLDDNMFDSAYSLEHGNVIEETNNKNIFQAFAEISNKSGKGFVKYNWTKASENGTVSKTKYPKLSYVQKFDEWGWVLGTGIYIDDIDTEFNNSIVKVVIIMAIILAVLMISFSMVSKDIVSKVGILKEDLENFFAYFNREIDEIHPTAITCKDEFGMMSRVVNKNIERTKTGIAEDRKLIDETILVLGEFEQGDLCQRLNMDVKNPSLMQLKKVLNNMAEHLEKNIDGVLDILEEYTHYKYLNKVETKNIKEDLLKLANGVNDLGSSITEILIENKTNGLTLDEGSDVLLVNMNKLNLSSTEAAASLEETAAALEQVTGNIRSNTDNIAKMAQLSSDVTKSANEGEELANKTTGAMEEINNQVSSIHEAITVIDQIAFQTNILSLNAAVEAATAGEAGKGFAVVAQEVRNLATRSAEAAKEIKGIVERATSKANEGKDIANDMINGYKNLNVNITHTINLIADIEMASKEQLGGIEQINDAVTKLDRQTQENASIAAETNNIATITHNISKLIVSNADSKEFIGKEKVKAKDLDLSSKKEDTMQKIEKKAEEKKENKKIEKAVQKSNNKVESTSSTKDEWESF